jgi:hypothetical protein
MFTLRRGRLRRGRPQPELAARQAERVQKCAVNPAIKRGQRFASGNPMVIRLEPQPDPDDPFDEQSLGNGRLMPKVREQLALEPTDEFASRRSAVNPAAERAPIKFSRVAGQTLARASHLIGDIGTLAIAPIVGLVATIFIRRIVARYRHEWAEGANLRAYENHVPAQ